MTNLFKFKKPSDSTGFLLWKTTHLWQRALTKTLKTLLIRTAHKTDTRAKVINLTDKGRQVLKKAIVAVEEFDQSFFGALAEQDAFNHELLRLMDNNGAENRKK